MLRFDKQTGVFALAITFTAISLFMGGSVFAQNLPWCAIMDNDGTTQCNYSSEQQCLQTLSGIGGRCILNPAGSGPQPAPSQQGLLPLQLQNPGPPPGWSAVPPPPNN
jgi:hypothetical protein